MLVKFVHTVIKTHQQKKRNISHNIIENLD
jgi:hypothetical protein